MASNVMETELHGHARDIVIIAIVITSQGYHREIFRFRHSYQSISSTSLILVNQSEM